MALAGRCSCGVRLDLAADDPEVHLICQNQKRCLKCAQVKDRDKDFYRGGKGGVDGACKACRHAERTVWAREKYQTDPTFAEAERQRVKLYQVLGPKTGKRRPPSRRQRPLFRTCKECHTDKPILEFRSRGRWVVRCKPCERDYQQEKWRTRYASDVEFRQKERLRKRLWKRGQSKKAA